jgi:hypothetical protein
MKVKAKEGDPVHGAFERYRVDIEKELTKTCHQIIKVIEE